jgi:hypothetical protein
MAPWFLYETLWHDYFRTGQISGYQEAAHSSSQKTIFEGTTSRSNTTKTQYICGTLLRANSALTTAAGFQSHNGNPPKKKKKKKKKKKMNKYLFDMYMETLSDELPPEVAAKRWPFPPDCA